MDTANTKSNDTSPNTPPLNPAPLNNNLHLACRFSAIAKAIPYEPCVIQGDQRLSYKDIDLQSNQLANQLIVDGIERDARVAVMERNSSAYIVSYLAALKVACIPCNINYKYQSHELAYILKDSGATVLLINSDFLEVFTQIQEPIPTLKKVIIISSDNSLHTPLGSPSKTQTLIGPLAELYNQRSDYQVILSTASSTAPQFNWSPPSNDDILFLLYTGGTTGYPKGVIWDGEFLKHSHELIIPAIRNIIPKLKDAPPELFAPRQGKKTLVLSLVLSFLQSRLFRWLISFNYVQEKTITRLTKLISKRSSNDLESAAKRAKAMRSFSNTSLIACPLMHGTGWLGAMTALSNGDPMVFLKSKSFDPEELFCLVEQERVKTLIIVGDAFAIPMLHELEKHSYDTRSLVAATSSGVVWSPRIKKGLHKHIPQLMILDSLGASEALSQVSPSFSSDEEVKAMSFKLAGHMKVFDENDEEVVPGSGTIGQLAVSGMITRGYWNDEEKTARTFRTIRGTRYALFGDMCKLELDGTITLLGRGSNCINTGGEKVFSEEVESVIKQLESVCDCAVIGVPDERWGNAVAGIVQIKNDFELTTDAILEHCKLYLANYKKPKHLWIVNHIPRKENGKMDYPNLNKLVEKLLTQQKELDITH